MESYIVIGNYCCYSFFQSVIVIVIIGIVRLFGGIVLGSSVASILYLFHWLQYKKRKAPTREITAEVLPTREASVELAPNRLPIYDVVESIEPPEVIEMQQNSAYEHVFKE